MFKTLPSALDYISTPRLKSLTEPAVAFFAATFGLGLIVMSYHPDGTDPEPNGSGTAVVIAPALETVSNLGGSGGGATFFVGFPADATVREVENEAGSGVDVSNGYQDLLRQVTRALAECAQGAAEPPLVQILGIASSSPFDSVPPDSSRVLNMTLANLRAQKVADIIHGTPEASRLNVTTYKWRDYEEMIQARRFRDRFPNGKYGEYMGLLNRRVEVHVTRAGNCELRAPLLSP